MLTKRENFMEVHTGGHPDRYVDNYEYFTQVLDPIMAGAFGGALEPDVPAQNGWGVWCLQATGEPGPMPLTDDEHKAITDVTEWRDQITVPPIVYPEEAWEPCVQQANSIDRNETFVAPMIVTGIFEKLHYMMGMEDTMCNFYEEPEAMHDLIDFLTDWELQQAEEIVRHYHPDAVFHHDDWGTQRNSFLSPDMFEEFLVPAYEKIYGYWKDNGVEIIIHHSDSYCANLLQFFPRMHIDVFQGAIDTNNIPKLIEDYGGQVTIMGGLNNGIYDKPDMTYEQIEAGYRNLFDSCPNQGKLYLVPGLTMGGPESVYPEVYGMCSKACANLSKEYFA